MSNQILELINYKPSAAIRAMVEGLLEQSEREDFEVDMRYYGGVENDVCYGCVATCSVQKIFNANYDKENINTRDGRASFLNISEEDLEVFEQGVDNFRQGCFYAFLSMFGFSNHVRDNIIDNIISSTLPVNFWMRSNNWKTYITVLKTLVLKLEESGY